MSVPASPAAMIPTGIMLQSNASRSRVTFQEMITLVREDWKTHHRKLFSPGFHALAVHRFGSWAMRLPRIARIFLAPSYRLANRFVSSVYGIELTWGTSVGRRVRMPHHGGIVIRDGVTIGDGCLIRHNVTLGRGVLGRKHDAPTLGKNVNIGVGAVIVGAVTIGDGARIGPNVVVMTNVPPGATVVIPPPRIIFPPNPRLSEVIVAKKIELIDTEQSE